MILKKLLKKETLKWRWYFPVNFNETLLHQGKAQIQIIADASDPNTATAITQYASAIVYGLPVTTSAIDCLYPIKSYRKPECCTTHN